MEALVDIVHQQVATANRLPYKIVGIGNQRVVGVGNVGGGQQTTIVLTESSSITEMLLVAVGQSVHLGVPVTDTPRGLCSILKRQAIVLQHIAANEELSGVLGAGKHSIERDRSAWCLLYEAVAELHVVSTSRNRHTAYHQRHNPGYDFMM